MRFLVYGVMALAMLFNVGVVYLLFNGPRFEIIETRYVDARLLLFDPPKHVWARLHRLDTNETVRASFGKHCNGWRDKVIEGRVYELQINIYRLTDRGVWPQANMYSRDRQVGDLWWEYDEDSLREAFC